MVSHRSGETEDNFIADLSVGLASGQVIVMFHFIAFIYVCVHVFQYPVNANIFSHADQDWSSLPQ